MLYKISHWSPGFKSYLFNSIYLPALDSTCPKRYNAPVITTIAQALTTIKIALRLKFNRASPLFKVQLPTFKFDYTQISRKYVHKCIYTLTSTNTYYKIILKWRLCDFLDMKSKIFLVILNLNHLYCTVCDVRLEGIFDILKNFLS